LHIFIFSNTIFYSFEGEDFNGKEIQFAHERRENG